MKRSEEQFRKTVELSPIPIVITDLEGKVEHFNRKFVELYGWTGDDIKSSDAWWEAIYPDEIYRLKARRRWEASTRNAIDTNTEPAPQQWTVTCKNGEKREVEFRMARVAENCCVITMDDITERKIAHQALEKSQAKLRQLADHLQTVREEERVRISRDIHDDVGQVLTALNMAVHWLKVHIPEKNTDIHDKVLSMVPLISTAISTVQRITSELRPPMIDDLGLAYAIQSHIEAFQEQTGIQCTFLISDEDLELDSGQATAVFRIMQEALTNVARHAEAERVYMEIKKTDEHMVMEITDNGRGIDVSDVEAADAFGLMSMKERALVFAGDIQIEGRPGEGTTVMLSMPHTKIVIDK